MFKKILFAGALLVGFATAYAQSSAPFGVSGTVTPGPCAVTISGGGTADLGSISTATAKGWSLNSGTNYFYTASARLFTVSVTCSAATKIALSMTDNNPGKIIARDNNDVLRFGLVNGADMSPVGSFQILINGVMLDGVSVKTYLSTANGSAAWSSTFTAGSGYNTASVAPGYMNSYSKTAAVTTPDAFTTFSGNLYMSISLGKNIIDTAATPITPTGSGTLTLVYL